MTMSESPGHRGDPKPGLPADIKDLFEALSDEITHLHIRWDTCMELFLEDESRSVLYEVAHDAFCIIARLFQDDFFTTVYRITDPVESGPKKNPYQNLTLAQLHKKVTQLGVDPAFLKTLNEKLRVIDSHCESIRKTREKIIGHGDMATILQPTDNPLPKVDWKDLEMALQLLAEFMNEISDHFTGVAIDFAPTVTGPAKNIVHALREFKRLQKSEFEREQTVLRKEIES